MPIKDMTLVLFFSLVVDFIGTAALTHAAVKKIKNL